MAWICPECEKRFKNKNQWHSCAIVDLGDHLKNKTPGVTATFDKLLNELRRIGDLTLNPVKTSIQVKSKSTFLSIRLKKDHIEIEFQLSTVIDDFPVYRTVRISRNRVLHFAVLEDPADIDGRLLRWLRESYELAR